MKEIWKDIPGYNGKYQASNLGRIRSTRFYGKSRIKILKPQEQGTGYLKITLVGDDGVHKQMLIHRLVAMAFIENPDKLDFVNHKDENKSNNVVDNLEWCTRPYNSDYSLNLHPERRNKYFNHFKDENGNLKRYGGKPPQHKETVLQKDIKGTSLAIYGCVDYAHKITGIKSSAIIACCKGKQKTAFGYIWEFLED